MAEGVKLSYEDQVYYIAEALANASAGLIRDLSLESAAYALSLAHSKAAAVVVADLRDELKNL